MIDFFKKNNSYKKEEKYLYNKNSLFYWRPKNGDQNFGDHLSHIITTKILADRGHFLEEETKKNNNVLAIGSIMHFANDGDVIWGSGVNGKVQKKEHVFKDLDVRAVRGPLTREFLQKRGIDVPEIYGDPALLTPKLFGDRFKKTSKYPFIIVPNMHDIKSVSERKLKNVLSPISSWNYCIEEIVKSEFVIASSLHGIIIAEAYGIPARYLRLSDTENLFKYNDYMMGTGRSEIEYAKSFDEAIEMGGMDLISFNSDKLLDAFPIDLWQ